MQVLQYLTKYCEKYQKCNLSPGCFAFTIKDNLSFNYNIIIDIIYIDGKPVLDLVDKVAQFYAR